MTHQCAGAVAEARRIWVALYIADSFIRRGQLAFERWVVACFRGQTVQVLERALDHELASMSRSRQVLDCVVKLEHERIRKLPDVIEPPDGRRPLAPRGERLPGRAYDPRKKRQHNQACCSNSSLVAPHKLPCPVPQRVFPRDHRQPLKVPPEVL